MIAALLTLANGVRPVAPLSEPKDYSGLYLPIIAITLLSIALVLGLMWWGWRARQRRQAHLPRPQLASQAVLEREPAASAPGMFVGTVLGAHGRFDRVAVHSLGLRSAAQLEVHTDGDTPGVVILRPRVDNLFLPAPQILDSGTGAGMAGKFVEPDGLVLITWLLGDAPVTSGFRPREAAARDELIAALSTLTARADGASVSDPAALTPSREDSAR
ncbi:MAG: hypothetical protein Q4G34_01995 [Micrococcus sp.]|nr:hypothetical protein [Micrococcus sp.]